MHPSTPVNHTTQTATLTRWCFSQCCKHYIFLLSPQAEHVRPLKDEHEREGDEGGDRGDAAAGILLYLLSTLFGASTSIIVKLLGGARLGLVHAGPVRIRRNPVHGTHLPCQPAACAHPLPYSAAAAPPTCLAWADSSVVRETAVA